ncbi:ParB/RepB/Spo0J family partition protein [Ideonella sp.]|uniref:ParB/RepB/Spo0J family partition protein n=1 Tax=Ideonella sp. TaxID=1929293 RepID=UPI003BB4F3C3
MNENLPLQTQPPVEVPVSHADVDIILESVQAAASPASAPALRKPALSRTPLVILALDPFTIHVPDAPNRLPGFADDPKFEELRINIASAGRNSVPVEVRALGTHPETYQLISGERRLLACQLEQLPVHAMVVPSDTPPEFDCVERIRENMGRDDPSIYELGRQLKHAAETLKPRTQGELAAMLGISSSKLSRAKDLAELPEDMISVFASAREIRVQDIKPLKDAFEANPEAVLLEAAIMRSSGKSLARADIVQRFRKAAQPTKSVKDSEGSDGFAPCKTPVATINLAPVPLVCFGKPAGHWALSQGALDIRIDETMSPLQRRKLLDLVRSFLESKVLSKPEAGAMAPAGAVATADVAADTGDKVAQATPVISMTEAA